MTHRTDPPPATPVERATQDLENQMRIIAESLHRQHRCDPQMNVNQFRRMLVLYFHGKSLREWCHVFAIPPSSVEGHHDLDHDHGGEG